MSKEVKIGLLVLVAFIAGLWGLYYLKGINLLSSQQGYYSVYENTAGLTVSSFVVYEGNKIGRVDHIELSVDSTGNAKAGWRIDFTVDNENLFIPENTVAEIGGSILSSKVIELKLGDSNEPALPGSKLKPSIQQDIAEQVTAELEPLKQSIEKLVGSVDHVVTNVNAIFEDDATKGLPEVFSSLRRSIASLETTFSQVNNLLAENKTKFGNSIGNIEAITKDFKNNSGKIDTVLTNFTEITGEFADIDFEVMLSKINGTLDEVNGITEKINNGDGTLSQVLNSDSLVVEIEKTNQELQYLLNDISTNPKKYLGFSVIGRKDRNGFSDKEEDRIKELIKEEK